MNQFDTKTTRSNSDPLQLLNEAAARALHELSTAMLYLQQLGSAADGNLLDATSEAFKKTLELHQLRSGRRYLSEHDRLEILLQSFDKQGMVFLCLEMTPSTPTLGNFERLSCDLKRRANSIGRLSPAANLTPLLTNYWNTFLARSSGRSSLRLAASGISMTSERSVSLQTASKQSNFPAERDASLNLLSKDVALPLINKISSQAFDYANASQEDTSAASFDEAPRSLIYLAQIRPTKDCEQKSSLRGTIRSSECVANSLVNLIRTEYGYEIANREPQPQSIHISGTRSHELEVAIWLGRRSH